MSRRARAYADAEIWHDAQKRHPLVRLLRGQSFWNGRDLRGHFTTLDTVDLPCPHACCRHRAAKDRPRVKKHRTLAGRRRESAESLRKRQRFNDAIEYDGYLHSHYLAAEEATNGFMVSPAGKARGYSGADFFKPGRRPSVEKWGSPELKSWFGSGNAAASRRGVGSRGVLSFTQYRAEINRARND